MVEERLQAVAHGVLGLELLADARGQGGVRAQGVAQGEEARVEGGPLATQAQVGIGAGGVHHRAVRQHHLEGLEGVVAVLHHPRAHARGVVADHAADHGGVDGGGVGADAGGVRGEHAVQVAADDPRLRPDAAALVQHPGAVPVGRQLHQQVVAHRLAGEGGAGGAEGQVAARATAEVEEVPDLAQVPRAHDGLGDEAVDRGIAGAAQAVDRAVEDAAGGDDAAEVGDEAAVGRLQAHSPTGTWKV